MTLPSEAPTWVAVLAGVVFCGGPLAFLVGAWVYQARQPNPEQAQAGQEQEG